MQLPGIDSAYEPSQSVVDLAWSLGYRVWAVYKGGPGALHNWSSAATARVRAKGFFVVPIYVPRLDLSTDPVADAQSFDAVCRAEGLVGSRCLDTEYMMRGNPRLAAYEAAFGDVAGGQACTYAGGFTLSNPPKHPAWWIGVPPAPGHAEQRTSGDIDGLSVDYDLFDSAFPLVGPPAAPVTPLPPPVSIGDNMHVIPVNAHTDRDGDGWFPVPGVTWDQVLNVKFNGAVPEIVGRYVKPGQWDGDNVNGAAQINIYGCAPNATVLAFVVAADAPAQLVAEGIEGPPAETPDPRLALYGGGHHDPRNAKP